MLTLEEAHMGRLAGVLLLALALTLLAATAVGAEGEEEKRTLGAVFNDGWISGTIETTYLFDRQLNTFDVDVEVKRGVVYVIGYVTDVSKRDRALDVARNTRGVKEVVDKLIVDPDYKTKLAQGKLFDQGIDDHWMSQRIKTRLIADPKVTGTWIGVEAEDGLVTLRGTVYKLGEIEKAEEIASGVPGVKEVKNQIVCCRM